MNFFFPFPTIEIRLDSECTRRVGHVVVLVAHRKKSHSSQASGGGKARATAVGKRHARLTEPKGGFVGGCGVVDRRLPDLRENKIKNDHDKWVLQ